MPLAAGLSPKWRKRGRGRWRSLLGGRWGMRLALAEVAGRGGAAFGAAISVPSEQCASLVIELSC